MKTTFTEHDGCFCVDLEDENMQEAATLTRFGMNRKAEVQSAETHVNASGTFSSAIVFGKSKRANSDVPKRK